MKPDKTQIKIKALDESLLIQKPLNINPVKLYYMAKQEEQPKEKTYTEKEVRNLLKKQVEECAKQIDAPSITEYTAKKKIREVKLVL